MKRFALFLAIFCIVLHEIVHGDFQEIADDIFNLEEKRSMNALVKRAIKRSALRAFRPIDFGSSINKQQIQNKVGKGDISVDQRSTLPHKDAWARIPLRHSAMGSGWKSPCYGIRSTRLGDLSRMA
uniref:Uncharacterized protein n=1 Tax=Acrobeloides nanus TaxID=290746 RepID=A0A914EED5_9BILA